MTTHDLLSFTVLSAFPFTLRPDPSGLSREILTRDGAPWLNIDTFIEKGTEGEVYKGKLIRGKTKIPVAIKSFFHEQSFLWSKEIQEHHLVPSPAVPGVLTSRFISCKRQGKTVYLQIMPLIDGTVNDLARQMRTSSEPHSSTQLIRIALYIYLFLVKVWLRASDRGLFHGDIKPKNIFYKDNKDGSREYFLGDWSSATLLDLINKPDRNVRALSLPYGAPECLFKKQLKLNITPWADYYSISATILNLLTGYNLPIDKKTSIDFFGGHAEPLIREALFNFYREHVEGTGTGDSSDRLTSEAIFEFLSTAILKGMHMSERIRKDSVRKGQFTNVFDIDYLGFPKLKQGLDILDQIIEQLMLPPVENPPSSSGTCGQLKGGRGGV